MKHQTYFAIHAGLGNQLFQLAAGLYTETILGRPLMFEVLAVPNNRTPYPRPFLLDQFMIDRPMHCGALLWRKSFGSSPRLMPVKKAIRRCYGFRVIDESTPHELDPQLETLPAGRKVLVFGFWQCKDYVEAVADRLRPALRFRHEPTGLNKAVLADINGKSCPVSLHIRRGDYQHVAEGQILLPLEYYRAAIDVLQRRFHNAHFFVFSDDPAWARAHLPTRLPATFVEGNGEARAHEDLRLMSSCRHHIIANSSFSWWGAWLNADPGKVVIMPRQWMGSVPTPAGLIPLGWETQWE